MSSEAAVSYASLILADAEVEITSDKILALTKAAGIEVEAVWAKVFAKAVEGKDLKEILAGFSAAPAAGSAPAAAGGAAPAAAVEEEQEEEKEESDEDMGMGLFD